ncbi:MAG: bifunctional phosphoribosylaminoimidazolecarboxamide formyltransferase/IMP cyclohydrolase, partial [Gemmatimonadales bacterium]
MPRALISVSDKAGIVEFATALSGMDWEIISTGGTAKALANGGIAVVPIETVTGFPEIMDGRVKTLHPAVHGGLLARRDKSEHMEALASLGFAPIDLVAVNLYPFKETIARDGVTFAEAIENIDIGGPSMLRSAAKNHQSVAVVVDPSDYDRVLAALEEGGISAGFRRELATKVFQHTAAYDSAIASYLEGRSSDLGPVLQMSLERAQALRYGENPDQRAALYVSSPGSGIAKMKQLHGKELSFNNLIDIDGAVMAIAPWPDQTACAVIKHTTPCGIAVGPTPAEAFRRARATDPTSAFGSVVSVNSAIDRETAEAMSDLFMEVVVAPVFNPDALEVLKKKKNLRIIEYPVGQAWAGLDVKALAGGLLIQDRFQYDGDESSWEVITERKPSDEEWADLRFAWAAVATVKSNAILLAKHQAAIGIGAGQMSRVDASFLAAHKALEAG